MHIFEGLETHLQDLAEVFSRINSASMKIKPSKFHFFQQEIKYLGHVVTDKGIKPDPSKIIAIKNKIGIPSIWSQLHTDTFITVKAVLTSESILILPNYDLPFIIHTDDGDAGLVQS